MEQAEPAVEGGVTAAVARRLHELARTEGTDLEYLDRSVVVDDAEDPASPLHHHFTWDDTEAARKHRLWEASALIRRVTLTLPVNDIKTKAWVNVELVPQGHAYVPVQQALSDEEQRDQLLRRALQQLQNMRRTYGHLSELSQIFAAADAAQARRRRTKGGTR